MVKINVYDNNRYWKPETKKYRDQRNFYTNLNLTDGLWMEFTACKSIRVSVWRRGKNIDSSSKSNPLRRRWKNYDASTWRRRRRRRKKWRKSTNFQQKFLWFTYSNNAHRNSGCPLHKWLSGALRQQGLLTYCSPSPYRKLKKLTWTFKRK